MGGERTFASKRCACCMWHASSCSQQSPTESGPENCYRDEPAPCARHEKELSFQRLIFAPKEPSASRGESQAPSSNDQLGLCGLLWIGKLVGSCLSHRAAEYVNCYCHRRYERKGKSTHHHPEDGKDRHNGGQKEVGHQMESRLKRYSLPPSGPCGH